MTELLPHLVGPWPWLVAGVVVLCTELLLPGMFLVWIGSALILVGAYQFFFELTFSIALISSVTLSIILVFIASKYIYPSETSASAEVLNERISGYIGRTYVLDWPIVNGRGKLRIDDTMWQIRGPDLPSGTEVRIHSFDGTQLHVSIPS